MNPTRHYCTVQVVQPRSRNVEALTGRDTGSVPDHSRGEGGVHILKTANEGVVNKPRGRLCFASIGQIALSI